MAGISDITSFIVRPSSVYGDVPTYVPPAPVIISSNPDYWQNSFQSENPVVEGAAPGLNIKTGFERPSLLDAIKEGLYKGMTESVNPLYPKPVSTGIGADTRMAGYATEAMSDPLKRAIADIIQTQINTRPTSIYSGYMR